MKRILIALVCCYVLVFGFTRSHLAQDQNQDQPKPPQRETVELDQQQSGRIEVPLAEVIRLSEKSVVPTIVENGKAYAIGFAGDALFKTEVQRGVSGSYGISLGKLAFSKPKLGAEGEGLFVVDLRTNEQQSLFPDHAILRAEWHPKGVSLAAIVSRGSDDGLLLYGIADGRVETIRQQLIQSDFLRWSKKGDTLYFIEGDSQKERFLVQRSFGTSTETRTKTDQSEARLLSAAGDLTDNLVVQHNSDGSEDLKLQSTEQGSRVVKNAVPISRVEGGLLLQFSDSLGTHLAAWNSKSGKLVLVSESGAAGATPPAPTAETGLPGQSFAALPSPLSRSQAQMGKNSEDGMWRFIDATSLASKSSNQAMLAQPHQTASLNQEALKELLRQAPMEFTEASKSVQTVLTLPMPDGTFSRFRIVESPMMEPELAAQFPEIKTYQGQGIDDPTATMRCDWTPEGFHAIVFATDGTVYVDPYAKGDSANYIIYFKRDYRKEAEPFRCLVTDVAPDQMRQQAFSINVLSGATLRTYRLALAASGEYTVAAGGTVANALARITTTVNRVNGIYQREIAVRMILVGAEASIIFTNPATDPYSANDSSSTTLAQNQARLDSVIGSANYDIGHVFNTGGGGRAGLGVVCLSGQKAQAATGLPSPVGDAFDVDFVAHEMGHQFGANHTFNAINSGNCTTGVTGTRVSTAAYEPGSGSTIMAYAGICDTEDLQAHSDDYFHNKSLEEILAYITSGTGSSCPVSTATGNTPPTISAGSSFTIPKSTPFTLTASASDVNGDAITYCWEEFDLGIASPPDTDTGGIRPIFRSFNPVSSASRTFPKLSDILNNTTTFGESLPSITRTMTFRVTARDNRAGGGGVNSASMLVNVIGTSGPFVVTSPNTATTWTGGTAQTVIWSVAGTTAAPVSCANVKISLSTDGGTTFPIDLAASTPNDGSETITVPSAATTSARVRVQGVGNVFFDVSNANFTILGGGCSGTKAVITSPAPGSTFGSSSVTFNWGGGSNVAQYWLYLGNTPGAQDLYSQSQGSNLSVTVNGIPTDGRTIYVTLWSYICGAWQSNAYTYLSGGGCTGTKAVMLSPPNGSSTSSSSVTFTWGGGSNVAQYWLYIGNSPSAADLYTASQGSNLSVTVNSLPTDGRTIYATLWSYICGAWQSNSYSYHAGGCTGAKAVMLSPANGSTLSSSTVTFNWSSGSNATQYWIYIGNSPGIADLYSANQGTNLSLSLSGLPTDGRTIYVTLWSYICGVWQSNSYNYVAGGCTGIKAVMLSPANGSTFGSSTVTFNWSSGSNATQYWIYIGNSPGAADLYSASQGSNLSVTLSGFPTDGRTVYVTLWSYICGVWQSNSYSYHCPCSGTKAVMLSPPNGSLLFSSTVTFTWSSGTNATQYWLYIGNTPGAADLYTASQGTNLSVTLSGFPRDGRTVYVTLWSYICGVWQANSYSYVSL